MKNSKVLITVFLVVFCLFIFASCTNGEKRVQSIEVTEGSFKSSYSTGEGLSLESATLLVLYEDKTKEIIPITREMVSGFSTEEGGSSTRVMTITYKEKSTTFTYTFLSSFNLDSSVRMVIEDRGRGNLDLSIGGGDEGTKIYSLYFEMEIVNGNGLKMSSLLDSSKWGIEKSDSGSGLKVIIYSKSGYDYLTSGQEILTLSVNKNEGNRSSFVYIKRMRFSNGERDFVRLAQTEKEIS